MQAASRESLLIVEEKFRELTLGMDATGLRTAADELASVARLLVREVVLRKHLTAATDDAAGKLAVVAGLLRDRVGAPVLELVETAVAQRWSKSRDLAVALDRFARSAILVDAERTGRLGDVEDELFRFARTLDANPALSRLLGDADKPVEGRIGLLRNVLGAKAGDRTVRLLEQAVHWPQATHFVESVDALAELAAARRGESVAHVIAAVPLSADQQNRLATVLSRIYGRTISLQTDIDPEILGGLRITVGDEVIDGTIASRLAAAASQLPR